MYASQLKLIFLIQLKGVMKDEFLIATRTSVRRDFAEGVRAVLVDKNQVAKDT